MTGRLIRSASDNGSEYLYEYDLNNNLTKLHQSAGGSDWTTEYTYDKDNRPVTVTVNGKTITDSYNGSLLMAQVQGSGTGQVKQLFSYDANGDVVSVNYNGTEYFYLRNG